MQKEFIPYKEALALKELGFDESCMGVYDKKTFRQQGSTNSTYSVKHSQSREDYIYAPLYQQAFRFFREKYKLVGEINLTTSQEDVEIFEFFVLTIEEPLYESEDYNIYEEAELACLRELIKITKNL